MKLSRGPRKSHKRLATTMLSGRGNLDKASEEACVSHDPATRDACVCLHIFRLRSLRGARESSTSALTQITIIERGSLDKV